ncbi:MAG: fibronectin type III domain-containing protein [Bacteroidota bacterium]
MLFYLRLSIVSLLMALAFKASAQVPALTNPANNATDVDLKTYLNCTMLTGAGWKYQLMYDTSATFNSPVLFNKVSNVWITYLDSAYFNTRYYWKMRSIRNNTDTSVWSATWSFKTIDSFEVTTPSMNATNTNIGLTVYFKKIGGTVRVQYDTTATFDSPVLTDTVFNDLNTQSLPVRQLYFGRNYYVRGMAYTVTDTIPFSKAFKFTTLALPTSSINSGVYDVSISASFYAITSLANDTNIWYQTQFDTSLAFNSPLLVNSISKKQTNTTPFLLHYGKNYYMHIRVWHLKDTSAWRTITISTKAGPTSLSYPTATDTIIRPDSARFTVFNMQGVKRYEIMADTTPLFNSPVLISDTLNKNANGALRNLYFNTLYYVKVRTITEVDTSDWFYRNIRTMAAPFLLTPQNNSTSQLTNPVLSWTNLSHLTGYRVMVDTSALFNSNQLMIIDSNKLADRVATTDLLFDQIYYWKMQARSAKDTSLWTPAFKFTTSPFSIYINTPYNGEQNVAVNPTYISWSQPTGIRGFHYQVSTDSLYTNPINRYINNRDVSGENLNGLAYSTRYFLRVRGFNKADTTDWYYENKFTTKVAPVAPLAPVLSLPANGAIKQPYTGLILTWKAVANVTVYEIQTDVSADFSNPLAGTNTTNQITVSGLQPSTLYYWRVRGMNGTQPGAWSVPFSFTTLVLLVPPQQLVPDNFTLLTPTQVTLQWEANTEADRYEYIYGNSPTFSGTPLTITQNKAVINNLSPGLTYYWQVRTVILPYASAWSNIATFRVAATGIQEVSNEPKQWFFPNPSSAGIINFGKDVPVQHITIYSLNGQKVLDTDVVNAALNISLLTKGVYMVYMQLNEKTVHSKLVIE